MPEISNQRVEKLASAVAAISAIVDEIRGESVEVPPETQSRVNDYVAGRYCLRCSKQKGGRYTRGLDVNCYNATMKEIDRNPLLENELIRKGRILPPARGGRPSLRAPATNIGELPALPTPDPHTAARGAIKAELLPLTTPPNPNQPEVESVPQSGNQPVRDKRRDSRNRKTQ